MNDIVQLFEKKKIKSHETIDFLKTLPSVKLFENTNDLCKVSTGLKDENSFEVKYDIPEKGLYTEAIVHRVKNGISVNYPEAYMRRRDPGTMSIADDLPSDKDRFEDKYGYPFLKLKAETFKWLEKQDLAAFIFFAGTQGIGSYGIAVAPSNAAFFAMGLSMLQKILSIDEIPEGTDFETILFVAPPFRHTHFNGKQAVIHNRLKSLHEVYAYNLYPGPSAKKGLYGVLLNKGEKEGWTTTHCSTVQVVSPYDNITTFMHEGASGGGKSEMLQHIVREPSGQVLLGRNLFSGEERLINIPMFCSFKPVTDDMALCHPSLQKDNGKLWLADAENAWFIRVDSVNEYGDDPSLEKISLKPEKPLLFLNIDATPDSTALIWDHIEDSPGKKCPNPRFILPRDIVPGIVNEPVSVDIRSFGVRTPPSTATDPSYGILGLFHILPPALAWLWRLVSPRGFANPSITGSGLMESEGVGSYWPFATGSKIRQANLLLEQFIECQRVRYTLVPNQHIGAWKVGFKPQLMMREYLTRRGNAKLRPDQYQDARCSLLGYELNYLTIEGAKIPSRFLKVYRQDEVGIEGYDAGAEILKEFFHKEIKQFLSPDLSETGKAIIEACLNNASVEDYNNILPMDYQYSFNHVNGNS
jgi:hypothetical protein